MTLEEFNNIIWNDYPNGDHSELYKNPDFTGYDAKYIPRLSILKIKLWDNGYATYTGEIKYKFNYKIYDTPAECIYAINVFEYDNRTNRRMTFGKYNGELIIDIIHQNPDYIIWCWKNVKKFRLNHIEAELLDAVEYNKQLMYSYNACLFDDDSIDNNPLEGEQFIY